MNSRSDRAATVLVFVLVMQLSLAGCGSGNAPTATEAGRTLKAHILTLLKERNARNVVITDPGGKNVPCGSGRAKQTFAATGQDLEAGTSPAALNDMMLGALKRVGHYELASNESDTVPVRVIDKETKTVLVLDSSIDGQYAVQGETECLEIS